MNLNDKIDDMAFGRATVEVISHPSDLRGVDVGPVDAEGGNRWVRREIIQIIQTSNTFPRYAIRFADGSGTSVGTANVRNFKRSK